MTDETQEGLRQVLWLPDERLRLPAYGGRAGARRAIAETADMAQADLVVLNTCHIREKAAEKVYSELGRVRARQARAAPRAASTQHRRRRLRRPGRGRGDPAPRRRASTSSSARRAITGCPSCCAQARARAGVVDTDFPAESKFDPLPAASRERTLRARRHGLRHRAGRLRQVLHLLRRALYARRRDVPAGRRDRRRGASGWRPPACARSRCSARTSTPITARARTARDWSLGRLLRRARRGPRHRAAALHDQPSPRHGRRN